MDFDKMANVIVSGCGGFYFGHWNLSRGVRERAFKRSKSGIKGHSGQNKKGAGNKNTNSTDAKE